MSEFVLLMGPQASGKTTLCKSRLPHHVRISQDELGKIGHIKALNEALAKGVDIVLDRTNPARYKRAVYLAKAKEAGYKTKILWLNIGKEEAVARAKARKGHSLKEGDVDQAVNYFFKNLRQPAPSEADEVEIVGDPPEYVKIVDIREEIGNRRYLVLGDPHGCYSELMEMLTERDFDLENDFLVCVGDLVDRGPAIKETLDFCRSLPYFRSTMGNHDWRCAKHFGGEKVKISFGLRKTIEAYDGKMDAETLSFIKSFPMILRIPHGYVVHAGLDPLMPIDKQVQADCLFMRHYGGKDYFDNEDGQYWFKTWNGERVFFGHEPLPGGYIQDKVTSLDGGCCFGDYMMAFDSRDGIVHYVSSKTNCKTDEKEE